MEYITVMAVWVSSHPHACKVAAVRYTQQASPEGTHTMHTTKRLYNLITEEAIFVLPPLLFFAGLMNYGWQRML